MNRVIVLFIFLAFIGCVETSNKKEVTVNKSSQSTVAQILLDSLSEAMHVYDKTGIKKSWDSILNNKNSVINYLMSFKGKKNISKWYWRDLKSSRIFARNYSMPSEEVAALFLICAIYYNDISFATSRRMYNNEILTIDSNSNFKNIDGCEIINIESVWDKVIEWNLNRNSGRPFRDSEIFWIGEDGGKINRINVKKTKWQFYG